MKAFLVYTALRLMLFVTSLVVIGGVVVLIVRLTGAGSGLGLTEVVFVVVLSAIVSAIGSWKFLRRQREELARVVEGRASRASEALERSRSKEDVD